MRPGQYERALQVLEGRNLYPRLDLHPGRRYQLLKGSTVAAVVRRERKAQRRKASHVVVSESFHALLQGAVGWHGRGYREELAYAPPVRHRAHLD